MVFDNCETRYIKLVFSSNRRTSKIDLSLVRDRFSDYFFLLYLREKFHVSLGKQNFQQILFSDMFTSDI